MLIQSPNTKCIIRKEIYSSQQKSLQSHYEVSAVTRSSERLCITTIIYSDVSMLGNVYIKSEIESLDGDP